ncbi:diaminopimelate epimerase [Candidatus Blochmannia ocreatus (nom. nud.)]|uniref:Diaminopimelate epimerase n=1 Tax=Candidatus Blochmannia ocreatus (nom. nud.) TaxID=251538 RepID=A0ABY4SYY8_9ENTR|nr:diaminopimelate epimerase [Candidatus Blochmannia ocreatus]URJ25054.1 diaminopimelate epimerase [Candidatus Blochmannia ocreatus]
MHFSKMHGLGNDFIIIDSISQNINFTSKKIQYLSNRYYGIGFDQLLIIESAHNPKIDFHCRIYNADGTEVDQCGNGIRCVARFVYMKKLTDKQCIRISTRSTNITLSKVDDTNISANMGLPIFDPKLIPFNVLNYQKNYILFLPQDIILCGVVSIGNPHCIILVKDINFTKLNSLGSILEHHHCFPKKINISFMQIINKNNIKLRVYERGVGETQACGTAACAAVAVGIKQKILCETVKVNFFSGHLLITWKGAGHPLYMTGATSYVYDGYLPVLK